MLTTLGQIGLVQRTYDRRIDALSKEAFIQREAAYFRENIGKVDSGDGLMKDYRLYSFAMKAFGLESEIYAKGLMKKVFDEGILSDKSTANRLDDPKYREIAEAFGFAESGNLNMLFEENVEAVVQRYLTQELELRQGEESEAVRLALYFDRQISKAENWYEVLADPALAEVVRTGLGLPKEFSLANIDRQAAYFEDRLKLEDFKDPVKRKEFIERFGAHWDMQQASAMGGNAVLIANGIAPIQPLAPGSAQIFSIDPSLLADLARYKI
ncbi:DUF1217 domain-containing protein [Rhodospirillaceae bacterium SYSU D60014]|uniref:DUF1217 domain-containing protein n=1 Tax=Virgifigura deserti TaxID=2268457 RepID=UPI000E672F45